jgi:hypothetical protein
MTSSASSRLRTKIHCDAQHRGVEVGGQLVENGVIARTQARAERCFLILARRRRQICVGHVANALLGAAQAPRILIHNNPFPLVRKVRDTAPRTLIT